MKSVSWLALIVGNLFDVIVSGLLGGMVLLFFISQGVVDLTANSPEQVSELLREPAVRAGTMLTGSATSIFSGYLAAWIAGRARLLHGAMSAILCVAGEIYALVTGAEPVTLLIILLMPLSPVLGLAGGYLRQRQVT